MPKGKVVKPEKVMPFSPPILKGEYISRMLIDEYGGILPSDPLELQKLPGVGRKTANVIASVVFRQPVMAVDTHVFRVSNRIGLVRNARTPRSVEDQLSSYIPDNLMHSAHHWLLLHGRYICKARQPLCNQCGLSEFCQYFLKKKKT